MTDPPVVQLVVGYTSLSEVLIVLPTDASHHLFEASQFVLQILEGVHQSV